MTATAIIEQDPLEELKKLRKAAPTDTTDPLDALRASKAAASEGEPGVGSKVLGVIASTVRDIPGVEAAQAGVRSLIRGQSYRDALSDIHGAEDAAPKLATVPARIAGGTLAALALPGGAARQGATFGALSGALQSDPNAGVKERVGSSLVDAALGGTLGAVGSGVNAIRSAPSGALKKAAGQLMPRNVQRAAKTWRTLRQAAQTQNAPAAAEAIPRGLPDFPDEAIIGDIAPQTEGALGRAVKQQGRTNGQLNADAMRLNEKLGLDLPLRPEPQHRPVEFTRPGSVEDAAQEDVLMQQLRQSLSRNQGAPVEGPISAPVQSLRVHDDGTTYLFTSPTGDQIAVSKTRFPSMKDARTYAERTLLQDQEPIQASQGLRRRPFTP
jgi:hypothetical protein